MGRRCGLLTHGRTPRANEVTVMSGRGGGVPHGETLRGTALLAAPIPEWRAPAEGIDMLAWRRAMNLCYLTYVYRSNGLESGFSAGQDDGNSYSVVTSVPDRSQHGVVDVPAGRRVRLTWRLVRSPIAHPYPSLVRGGQRASRLEGRIPEVPVPGPE